MNLANLTISRIIFHEVYRRRDDRSPQPPSYGANVTALTQDAMDELRERIINATGSQSQSMEMTIVGAGADSAVTIARDLLAAPDDASFAIVSQRVADLLTSAQLSRNIPGGVLAVFSGTAGNPQQPVVGFIKAELHGGFRRGANLTVEYLKTLFMTPQTKLYKIGVFGYDGGAVRPLPEGWTASVYDNQMSAMNRDGAARYFFEGFLGLDFPKSAARMTRKFWEGTSAFIQSAPVTEEKRSDLLTGLYSYLRVDQAQTVDVATFANSYLDQDLRTNYRNHMQAEGFPTNAVAKDLSELQGKLKRRRVRFSQDVQLTASAAAFKDLIEIETFASPAGSATPIWTRITVHDHIRDQQ